MSTTNYLRDIRRGMPLSEITLGKVVQRFLLYVSVALAVLVVVAAGIVLTKGAVGRIPRAWMALAVFTLALFWVTIRQSRAFWRRMDFWLAIAGLLVVHLLVFVAILSAYPQWREIWFVPVTIVECGLFGAILYLLFAEPTHR